MHFRPPVRIAEFETLPLRVLWAHEAQVFTPWLAANLDRLGEAIGAPLRLLETKAVAAGRIADLLARDERDGSLVLIENQLEASDDAHLGQILSYLASVEAKIVVWIAARFTPPHLSAMRWLNQNTDAAFGFYAIRIRVAAIGGSALAPVFDVLERPSRSEPAPPPCRGDGQGVVGGFAAGFWAAHLARYPDEARLSRPVGERCRWRATRPQGLVIGQRVQDGAASVFLRGRNGVTIEEVIDALAPVAGELEARLGVSLRGEDSALLAQKRLAIDVANPSSQLETSD